MIKLRRLVQATVPAGVRAPVTRFLYNSRRRWAAPWYQLADERFRSKGSLLEAMQGEFAGERCVVMGNGPSLNAMDLSRFETEKVWASNRAYLLLDRIEWRPQFWVAVDRRVVPDIARELSGIQANLPRTRFFYPDHFLLDGSLRSQQNTFWFRELSEPKGSSQFSLAPPSYVASSATVTISAIQLAVFLGFDPIYLIGCDTSYVIPESTRIERNNPELLLSTSNRDPNHFDPTYFGEGRRWHNPHVERMFAHYEKVRAATDMIGVRVFNATVGGDLEIFPRVNYEDTFARA